VKMSSNGPVFFCQERCGKGREIFLLHKFRTMYVRAKDDSKLTVASDRRVTGIGRFLRATKLDELPQFVNVLKGDMTLIGPRPEVKDIVDKYEPWMNEIFDHKPGLADTATFEVSDEPEILAASTDPDRTYMEEILPRKIRISLKYQRSRTTLTDIGLIFRIIGWMLRGSPKPIAK